MLACSQPLGDAALRGTGVWSIGYSRAVPSCAGAYVSGAAGSNACPAGSVRIVAEAACRTAAAAAGKTAGSTFVVIASGSPRGCYFHTSTNDAYFNTHAVGAGYSRLLLCAALVTSGAPPPHAADARARVYTCVPALRVCCALRIIMIQMAYI